jgi:hypothetical protein
MSEKRKETEQHGGITDKRDKNAGSGAFNQGSAQDPDPDRGASDKTKDPGKASREPQNPGTRLDDADTGKQSQ